MKQFFKLFGLAAVLLFSFYYTEKTSLLVQERSPIMQEIKSVSDDENTNPVNAVIENNTIIPGINGLVVNSEESFVNMNGFGVFNEYYLTYEEIKPTISLEDNKDKVIISGNKNKKEVTLIIDNNLEVETFLKSNSVKYVTILHEDNLEFSSNEQLNGESKKDLFMEVEEFLNSNDKNVNICLMNGNNKQICQEEDKYLVEATNVLTESNYIETKNSIGNGSIVVIKSSVSINNINLLVKHLNFKGFKIVNLSELISETVEN